MTTNIAIPAQLQTPYEDRYGAKLAVGDMVLVISHDTVDHIYDWNEHGLVLSDGALFNPQVLVKVVELAIDDMEDV